MKNRSELREIIMKVLYQINILRDTKLEYNIKSMIKDQLEMENEFVDEVIFGVIKHYNEIVVLANKYLDTWKLNRLNKVDQAILCMGIYELQYSETPAVVAINEAIELSKRYSDEKITKMINAVLDGIYKNGEDHAK